MDMADGSTKRVDEVRMGDRVVCRGKETGTVRCVVKCPCTGAAGTTAIGELLITPWHPVRLQGRWQFPCKVGSTSHLPCEAVYSFLLEDNKPSISINGVECICLGHGIEGDKVATHAIFGTNIALKILKAEPGWEEGLVLTPNMKKAHCKLANHDTASIHPY